LSEGSPSSKDLEKALSLAKKAQETRPEDPSVLDTLGWIYFKIGDTTTALTYLSKAAAKAPENGLMNYHMGMASHKSGKMKEAKEYFKKAVESPMTFDQKEDAKKMLSQM